MRITDRQTDRQTYKLATEVMVIGLSPMASRDKFQPLSLHFLLIAKLQWCMRDNHPPHRIKPAVPQGYVLGHRLLLLYIIDLPDHIRLQLTIYVDNSTFYTTYLIP